MLNFIFLSYVACAHKHVCGAGSQQLNPQQTCSHACNVFRPHLELLLAFNTDFNLKLCMYIYIVHIQVIPQSQYTLHWVIYPWIFLHLFGVLRSVSLLWLCVYLFIRASSIDGTHQTTHPPTSCTAPPSYIYTIHAWGYVIIWFSNILC